MAGKIGDGTLAAMGRLGLKELRNAINPSKESVADSEVGIYGSMTQGEIASARSGPGEGPEQEAVGMDSMRIEAQAKTVEADKAIEALDVGIQELDQQRGGMDR